MIGDRGPGAGHGLGGAAPDPADGPLLDLAPAGEVGQGLRSWSAAAAAGAELAHEGVHVVGGDPAALAAAADLRELHAHQARQAAHRRPRGNVSAGAALGHKNMSATAIYAERNQGLADEAARRLG